MRPPARILLLTLALAGLLAAEDNPFNPSLLEIPQDAGQQPVHDIVLPPAWAFGVLYGGYGDQTETLRRVDEIQGAGLPIDAYWIDSSFWDLSGKGPKGYIDFRGDRTAYPDPAALWRELDRRGIRSGIWIWNRLMADGGGDAFAEFQAQGWFSSVVDHPGTWHNRGDASAAGFIDFDNPKAVRAWQDRLKPLFDDGLDFLKLDGGASLGFVRAGFEASQVYGRHSRGRGFTLAHAANLGDPAFRRYPTRWTSDSACRWSQPDYPNAIVHAYGGLAEQVRMFADSGHINHRVPFLTGDAGGYAHGKPTPELMERWVEFAAYTAVMEIFGDRSNLSNHPFQFGPETVAIVRRATRQRLRLFPYLYSCALAQRLTNQPFIDGDGLRVDQFRCGPNLVVAPVLTPETTSRPVALAAGSWYAFETGEAVQVTALSCITAPAPRERIPVYAPAGAIIPLRDEAGSVLAGTSRHLTLRVFPGKAGSFTLAEDDGASNAYLQGTIRATRLTTATEAGGRVAVRIAPATGTYEGSDSERTWTIEVPGRYAFATVNGHPGELQQEGPWSRCEVAGPVTSAQDIVLTPAP